MWWMVLHILCILKFFLITLLKFLVTFCWYLESTKSILAFLCYESFCWTPLSWLFSLLYLTWPVISLQAHTQCAVLPASAKLPGLPSHFLNIASPQLPLPLNFSKEEMCTLSDNHVLPCSPDKAHCSSVACLYLFRSSVVFICVSKQAFHRASSIPQRYSILAAVYASFRGTPMTRLSMYISLLGEWVWDGTCVYFNFILFWDGVPLYSSAWTGTHFVDQTGLEFVKPCPGSACQVLELKTLPFEFWD